MISERHSLRKNSCFCKILAISNVIRIRSSNVMGSNCEAVVCRLLLDDRRDRVDPLDFFRFSKLGTTYLLDVTPDSQLTDRGRRAGRFSFVGECKDSSGVCIGKLYREAGFLFFKVSSCFFKKNV